MLHALEMATTDERRTISLDSMEGLLVGTGKSRVVVRWFGRACRRAARWCYQALTEPPGAPTMRIASARMRFTGDSFLGVSTSDVFATPSWYKSGNVTLFPGKERSASARKLADPVGDR
jgi:hypothetical protein